MERPVLIQGTYPLSSAAPGAARRLVRALAATIPPSRLADVEVILSELITNSVRYSGIAGSEMGVDMTVRVSDGRVRIEVVDRGYGFTPAATARSLPGALLGQGGLGLYLVDRLADRWGADTGRETRVWAEVSLSDGAIRRSSDGSGPHSVGGNPRSFS